ncbi:molecular chaperone GroEL [Loktanella sp. DJP18]|uniref:molecular chaperone GroEL n=1 Tax=Loktanella sp. DJP18 TaxID=3409788 RepID=UPI003BB51E6B
MTDTIQHFFDAWGEGDATRRRDLIAGAMADDFIYADPRTGQDVTTLDALADYVGEFTATAVGWTATVVQSDGHGDHHRAVIAFLEDGEARQHGTYYAHMTEGQIAALIGFVGAGGLSA